MEDGASIMVIWGRMGTLLQKSVHHTKQRLRDIAVVSTLSAIQLPASKIATSSVEHMANLPKKK